MNNSDHEVTNNTDEIDMSTSASRVLRMKQELMDIKDLCRLHPVDEDNEDRVFFDTVGEILEGLERAIQHHFEMKTGLIFSPKSDEPWD